ncbi:uncharacterized protein LOC141613858 [Silene latifolia]|uniref:uncharacterized protein LOC141613858 n=1 Tax=Silene latifolia TaxID=37657 RepID=UPI003D785B43
MSRRKLKQFLKELEEFEKEFFSKEMEKTIDHISSNLENLEEFEEIYDETHVEESDDTSYENASHGDLNLIPIIGEELVYDFLDSEVKEPYKSPLDRSIDMVLDGGDNQYYFFLNLIHVDTLDGLVISSKHCFASSKLVQGGRWGGKNKKRWHKMIIDYHVDYWALGIVFVAVVNDLLGRYSSFTRSVWNGSNLGIKRLSGFILMRWAVRDAVTQVLELWYFGEIRDQYSFFKLFLRLKLMPFSVASPWVPGYDKEISGFLFAWFLIDSLVSFVLAVNSWVTIVSTRRDGREIIKEGVFGDSIAFILQALIEVYFMVSWLINYLAARCKDASLSGREFGRTELEGVIEGLR